MTDENNLPTWFRKLSNIGYHCSYGITALFVAFKINWINRGLSENAMEIINLTLIIIGIPCVILSGPRVMGVFKKIKEKVNDTNN